MRGKTQSDSQGCKSDDVSDSPPDSVHDAVLGVEGQVLDADDDVLLVLGLDGSSQQQQQQVLLADDRVRTVNREDTPARVYDVGHYTD